MNDVNALLTLMQNRRSVRKFTNQPVPHDLVLSLLEAARWAPSNHNRQPWKFLIIENQPIIQALAAATAEGIKDCFKRLPELDTAIGNDFLEHATFFSEAPLLIVALHRQPTQIALTLLKGTTHPELISGEPLSTAMAVQNLLLAIHAAGLGACVLTAPLLAAEAWQKIISLPPAHSMTCLVALGYPAEQPEAPRRKKLETIAEYLHTPPQNTLS